jgi:hypothetical protein
MKQEPNKSSTRLDSVLCVLTIAAALGFVTYAALAPVLAPLTA